MHVRIRRTHQIVSIVVLAGERVRKHANLPVAVRVSDKEAVHHFVSEHRREHQLRSQKHAVLFAVNGGRSGVNHGDLLPVELRAVLLRNLDAQLFDFVKVLKKN